MKAEIFGWNLTSGELKIVGAVLDPEVLRLSICAMTRYGKTRAVAIACLLLVLQKKVKIAFIAPTLNQTNIMRNYVAEHISETPALLAALDDSSRSDAAFLKKELSRRRLTFKNGSEIITLTAHGTGEQLMGYGADIVILDEVCQIEQEVYTSRISRMLGDNPNSKLVELMNPWHRHNFAYQHWISPEFKKIHINWKQALKEGRVTETFLEEQRSELSKYEFTVLYESEFAEESEDTLIRWDWIQAALTRQITFLAKPKTVWGLDVAEQGIDLTILSSAETDGIRYKVTSQQHLMERETMPTANHAAAIIPKTDSVNVDSIGVGAGVHSRMTELGCNAVSVRVSMSPTSEADRYLNQKSQRYWHLRNLFEQGYISIPNIPKLISQLSQIRYEFTSVGKIRIIDPEGKSPDHADSLMLTLLDASIPLGGGSVPQVLGTY